MRLPSSLFAIVVGSLTIAAVAVPAEAKEKSKAKNATEQSPFDRDQAGSLLRAVELLKCKIAGGPRGEGHVLVTFAPSGDVQTVSLDRAPFARSPVESCILGQYRTLKVKPFKGDAVTVGKTFRID